MTCDGGVVGLVTICGAGSVICLALTYKFEREKLLADF